MKVDDGKLSLAQTGNMSELNTTGADGFASDEVTNNFAVNDNVGRVCPLQLANEYANEQSGNVVVSGSKALLLEQYRALLA